MRKPLICLTAFCLLVAGGAAFAQDGFGRGANTALVRSSVLPVEEAFAFNAFIEAPDTVVLLWEIEAGYYLYRDSIRVTYGKQNQTAAIGDLPPSESHTDEFFGDTDIYRDRLLLRFPLAAVEADGAGAAMNVHFQGCAEDKYCYPEKVNSIVLSLPR